MKYLNQNGSSTTWEINEADRSVLARLGAHSQDKDAHQVSLKFLSLEEMNAIEERHNQRGHYEKIKENGTATTELSVNELHYLDIMIPSTVRTMGPELDIIIDVSMEEALATHGAIQLFLKEHLLKQQKQDQG